MPSFIGTRQVGTTEGGWGWEHQRTRRQAFAMLPEWSPCCRCGGPMWKFETERYRGGTRSALHYDHNDQRDGYLGWSHRLCNLRAGARRGGQIARLHRRRRQSRDW